MAKPRKTNSRKRKTKDKGDEAEMRKGELSLEPVVIDSSTFHFHMKAIKSATERKDTANNLLRGCYKAAKLVNEHLADTIRELITLERTDDPAKLRRKLETLGIGLKETGSPIQLTVHDTLMGDVVDAAYKRGHDAGANGRPLNCPYPENSDLAEAYGAGWRNGTGGNLGLTNQEIADAVGDGIQDAIDKSGIGHNSAQAAE